MANLKDLASCDNAALREILANPDHYIPEAVHAAAKELASRAAVPRYYTMARTRVGEGPVRVTRRIRVSPLLKVRMLFSEARLRFYTAMIAMIYTIFFLLTMKNTIDLLRRSRLELLSAQVYITTGLSLMLQLLMCLFFWALASNLVSRRADTDRP